nr:hypothetical protein [uncultured Gellertiella sp.]
MTDKKIHKILQTKLAVSDRSIRLNVAPRLSILEAVQRINAKFTTPSERRARTSEGVIECRGFKHARDVVGIHLVGYVPDEHMGIVPHKSDDLTLYPPPDDADFLDGELMALISSEAVIVCRLGLYESALNKYIQVLGPKAGLNREDALFLFKNRTDVDKLKMIQDDGVASIRFQGTANKVSVDHAAKKDKPLFQKMISGVWTEIQALAYGEEKPPRVTENLKIEVYLKFDGRSGTKIDQEEIKEVAQHVAETDEGFSIKTLSGRTITPTDVLLNKKILLHKFGKSVAFNEVFEEMLIYHDELMAIAGPDDDG